MGKDKEYRICDICGKKFIPKKWNQRFCSTTHIVKCVICGKDFEKMSKYIKEGKDNVCNNKKCLKEKRELTCLKKYGVRNSFQSEEIKEKIKKTNLDKYGVEYASQSEVIRKKVENTNLERYNETNPAKCEEVKEKIKKTNLKRYGVRNPLLADEIRDKIKKD